MTWYLGRYGPSDDPAIAMDYDVERELTLEEVEQIKDANSVMATLTPSYLLGPLLSSAEDLHSQARRVLAEPSTRALDVEEQVALGMALDQWLIQFSAFKNRTMRDVSMTFGSGAKKHARAQFDQLYQSDSEYRFCWEWRNAAQHVLKPASITTVQARLLPDGSPTAAWSIKTDQCAGSYAWTSEVKGYLDRTPLIDCLSLISTAVSRCEDVAAEILVHNQDAIREAARTITRYVHEVQLLRQPGRAVAFKADPRDGGGLHFELLAFRTDLVTRAMLGLQKARARLEQSQSSAGSGRIEARSSSTSTP